MVTRIGTCAKCGEIKKVVAHHKDKNDYTKDGDCRVVDYCMSCHKITHLRIRGDGACPLSPAQVAILSRRSTNRRTTRTISFIETLMPNVRLHENILYNIYTGHVYARSYFAGHHGKELKNIDI